jgi:hypothetical protein
MARISRQERAEKSQQDARNRIITAVRSATGIDASVQPAVSDVEGALLNVCAELMARVERTEALLMQVVPHQVVRDYDESYGDSVRRLY